MHSTLIRQLVSPYLASGCDFLRGSESNLNNLLELERVTNTTNTMGRCLVNDI